MTGFSPLLPSSSSLTLATFATASIESYNPPRTSYMRICLQKRHANGMTAIFKIIFWGMERKILPVDEYMQGLRSKVTLLEIRLFPEN
jgi:hypothetical protein